jgi:hypothetical protein
MTCVVAKNMPIRRTARIWRISTLETHRRSSAVFGDPIY